MVLHELQFVAQADYLWSCGAWGTAVRGINSADSVLALELDRQIR